MAALHSHLGGLHLRHMANWIYVDYESMCDKRVLKPEAGVTSQNTYV